MKVDFNDNEIKVKKELSDFEKTAFVFFSILNKNNVKYAVVAGYLNIMFGRPRATEDIDIVCAKLGKKPFFSLWKEILNEYDCINTNDPGDAYENYLNNKTPIRFCKSNEFIPNIEFKFTEDEADNYTIENRVKVLLNKQKLYISPLELQITYKLYLGTEKDIEDARFLYDLFEKELNEKELNKWIIKLNIGDKKKYLGDDYG